MTLSTINAWCAQASVLRSAKEVRVVEKNQELA